MSPGASSNAPRIRKLQQIAEQLHQGASFSITRLTLVKSLCADSAAAARFALCLAERTQERMLQQPCPSHLTSQQWISFQQLATTGVECMRRYLKEPTPEALDALRSAHAALEQSQNEHRRVEFNEVRIIESREALVVEHAAACILRPQESQHWGYRVARQYAERYNPRYGNGLIPESAPFVQDIADFWRAAWQEGVSRLRA